MNRNDTHHGAEKHAQRGSPLIFKLVSAAEEEMSLWFTSLEPYKTHGTPIRSSPNRTEDRIRSGDPRGCL